MMDRGVWQPVISVSVCITRYSVVVSLGGSFPFLVIGYYKDDKCVWSLN